MSIKNLKPSQNSRYEQGYYVIQNPEKYRGDTNKIIVRSSYEKKMCIYCDLDKNVISWSSEPIAIAYTSKVDGRRHKYWIDYWVKLNDGREFLVEVKPNGKLKKPRTPGKNATAKKIYNYNTRLKEYLVNLSKFEAAITFANQVGMEFIIADEDFLFNIK
jgi:hypothetical protein